MKLFKWTTRPFLASTRKVSTHFIAEEWARAGHDVYVATVGFSSLSKLKDNALYEALSEKQKNRFLELEPGLKVTAYLPPLHPFSSRSNVLNLANRPAFRIYGSHVPRYLLTALEAADVVVFEPGTCLSFFHAARRVNPSARFIYIWRDLLSTIGAGPYLQDLEKKILPEFDEVLSPSSIIARGANGLCPVRIVPQAIQKDALSKRCDSPYPDGTRNAVSVGNMLFDEVAINAMAAADRSVTYHAFGARFAGPPPENVIDHGERPFEDLVPYIQHADFGVAPYRMRQDSLYLAETSLKFLQYAYCMLPVLTPDVIPGIRGNLIGYSLTAENDWPGKVRAALAMKKDPKFREGILSWSDVAALLISGGARVSEAKAAV